MEISFPAVLWKIYELDPTNYRIEIPGSGHINQTFLLLGKADNYVLQKLNQQVFKQPWAISHNIHLADRFLKTHYPNYLFVVPLPNRNGELLTEIDGEFWRMLPFISDTVALDVLTQPIQAYEAAKAFGRLTQHLAQVHVADFQISIPQFHDLAWRKEQFDHVLNHSSLRLKETAKSAIGIALNYQSILDEYLAVKSDLRIRIIHHDTKISNVLLDKKTFAEICVIDLDTLMPGYFISDLGDMMRTYLCAYDENEADLSKIEIRTDYFKAMLRGYLSAMGESLTTTEKKLILFSGKYIIYMQALRFLTDYLEGSIYYPTAYSLQNLDRAHNQFQLLSQLFEKEKHLQQIVDDCLT